MARCHYDAKHDAKPSAESRPVRKTSPPQNRTSSTSDSSDEFRWMCAHAAFVPTLVLSRIASNPMAKAEAYQETFPAAVLFVDIAGYVRLSGATHAGVARRETRLGITSRGWEKNRGGDNDKRCGKKDDDDETEARSKENSSSRVAGLAGEAMRDLVSACFASVVSTVHKHGGDVVKFAGDALFAVWKAEPRFGETLGEACLRATQCGVEIQDASQSSKAVCTARQISVRDEPCERRYEKDIPPKALRLKVVVGAGTVKGIHVGGVDDRWEYLISGDPVAQIGRDQKIATPGTVVVSREMMLLETMRDHCVVVEVGCMLDATVDAEEYTNGREVRDTEKTSQDPHETQGKVLSRSRSGKSIFPLFSGGSIGTNGSGLFSPRSTHGFRRKSTETAFRVTGLTNGFDDAPVEYFFKPRRGVNREAIVKRVLDKDKDLLQPLIKAVSRYVPKCVTTASQENNTGRGGLSLYQNMWRGEIRRCAVVFLDVRMSNVSEVEFVRNRCLLQASSTAMEITQKTLKRLDGSLRQFLVDDKGSVIIAVFGLPGMAHHDDAERAVRFATTTISWLEKNGGLKNAKAGVTFGDVFCGAVGPATRCEYAVYGDAVNTAARLMTHPRNECVLACAATKQACEVLSRDSSYSSYRFRAEPVSLRLKGKIGLTETFAPVQKDEENLDTLRDKRPQKKLKAKPVPPTTKYTVMDTLPPQLRRLTVLASALGETFGFDVLLAAANGIQAPADAFTRRDVRDLLETNILRVAVDDGCGCCACACETATVHCYEPVSTESTQNETSAADVSTVTHATVSFDACDTVGTCKKGWDDDKRSVDDTRKAPQQQVLLTFTDPSIRAAAVGTLTCAVRAPANATAALFLERFCVGNTCAPHTATTTARLLPVIAHHWTSAGFPRDAVRCLARLLVLEKKVPGNCVHKIARAALDVSIAKLSLFDDTGAFRDALAAVEAVDELEELDKLDKRIVTHSNTNLGFMDLLRKDGRAFDSLQRAARVVKKRDARGTCTGCVPRWFVWGTVKTRAR